MITSKIELIKITATEGMTLTNGEVLSKEIYLGKNDKVENWYEITDEEAAMIAAEKEKLAEGRL